MAPLPDQGLQAVGLVLPLLRQSQLRKAPVLQHQVVQPSPPRVLSPGVQEFGSSAVFIAEGRESGSLGVREFGKFGHLGIRRTEYREARPPPHGVL